MLNVDFIERKGRTRKSVINRIVKDAWGPDYKWVPQYDHQIGHIEQQEWGIHIYVTDGDLHWARGQIEFEEKDSNEVLGKLVGVSGGGYPNLSRRQKSQL